MWWSDSFESGTQSAPVLGIIEPSEGHSGVDEPGSAGKSGCREGRLPVGGFRESPKFAGLRRFGPGRGGDLRVGGGQ